MFSKIFEEVIYEGNHLMIDFDDTKDKGIIIKSVNGCNTSNVFREKLFFARKNAFEVLIKDLEKLSNTEKILALEFVKIRLKELEESTKKSKISDKHDGKLKEHFLNCRYKNENDEVYENIKAIVIAKGFTNGSCLKTNGFIKEYYKQSLRIGLRDYVSAWSEMFREIEEEIDKLLQLYKNKSIEDIQLKSEEGGELVIPKFKPEYITDIYNVLKIYFPTEQQKDLLRLLETGKRIDDVSHNGEMLMFNDIAIRLADAFRVLKNNDIITCCEKKDVVEWIIRNFKYRKRGGNDYFLFNRRTLEDYLYSPENSKSMKICKEPIFEIKEGRIC